MENADIAFVTVPALAVNQIIQKLALANSTANIVLCSKGFSGLSSNIGDLLFSNYIKKILPNNKVFVFSGPSFADGIIDGISTCVSLATEDNQNYGIIFDCFAHSNITLYTTNDITGVQILGAIKGTIAIKIGILEALINNFCIATNANPNLYNNKIYKMLSEIIMEVQQIVLALDGHPGTIISPAGIGDIMMVCNSEHSRNKRFGIEIGNILWQKMLNSENLTTIKNNLLSDNVNTNLLTINDIENSLILLGKMVEGYFVLPKIDKILKNIQITAPHLEWMCDIFRIEFSTKQ